MRNYNLLQIFADPKPNTNTTGSSFLSETMHKHYVKKMLENARSEFQYAKFGMKTALPKGSGKDVNWRAWETFAADVTPLVEGVTPDGETLKLRKVETTTTQHGNYVTISDRLDNTAFDNVILGASEELGAQGGESQDILVRNTLIAGTNVLYAGGKVSRETLTSKDVLTRSLVNKAYTILKKNKTPKIDGKYIAIIHPSVAMDLRNDPSWIDVHKYEATREIFNGEIGELDNVRFLESTNCKVWHDAGAQDADNTSVYGNIFFGKDAYGVVDPEGAGWQLIVKPAGSAGTADPLNQRSTIGYKFTTGSAILNQERLLRVETGSSFGTDDLDN